jgi:hypothetical protein
MLSGEEGIIPAAISKLSLHVIDTSSAISAGIIYLPFFELDFMVAIWACQWSWFNLKFFFGIHINVLHDLECNHGIVKHRQPIIIFFGSCSLSDEDQLAITPIKVPHPTLAAIFPF